MSLPTGMSLPTMSRLSQAGSPGTTLRGRGEALEKHIEAFTRLPLVAGAPDGVKRLRTVSERFEALSPADIYRLIDPPEFEREVAEVNARGLNALIIWRNVFSILPLICTWAALFIASIDYSLDKVDQHPINGQSTPFFVLWQNGFGTNSPTFTQAAVLDVCLLLLFLTFTILAQRKENHAQQKGLEFARQLQDLMTELIGFVADNGMTVLDQNAPVHTLVEAVNQAIQRAINAGNQVAADSQAALQQMKAQMTSAVSALESKLQEVQAQLVTMAGNSNDLGAAGRQLANSADKLSNEAGAIVAAGTAIQGQITSLNATEAELVRKLDGITGDVRTASDGMKAATTATTQLTQQLGGLVHTTSTTVTQTAQMMGKVVDDAARAIGTNIDRAANYIQNAAGALNATQNGLGHAANAIENAGDRIESAAILLDQAVRGGSFGVARPRNLLDALLRRGKSGGQRRRKRNQAQPRGPSYPNLGYPQPPYNSPPMRGQP